MSARAYMRSLAFRPCGGLPYEHMFSVGARSARQGRLLEAARLVRAFLMLEDELLLVSAIDADGEPLALDGYATGRPGRREAVWEGSARGEPPQASAWEQAPGGSSRGEQRRAIRGQSPAFPPSEHPHRLPLRAQSAPRRPGTPPPRDHVCLCPLPPRALRSAQDVPGHRSAALGD